MSTNDLEKRRMFECKRCKGVFSAAAITTFQVRISVKSSFYESVERFERSLCDRCAEKTKKQLSKMAEDIGKR